MTRALLTGGAILTMDPARPRVDAIGVLGEKIVACGSETEVASVLGDGADRVDLGGGALLPAFIDAHHHYCMAALDRRAPDLHAAPGEPISDVLARLESTLHGTQATWIRAQGYDPHKLREGRAPLREELDALCPDRPLLLIAYSCHEGVLNSMGLECMGWNATTPDPPGGALRRRRGKLTGEVMASRASAMPPCPLRSTHSTCVQRMLACCR